MAYERRNGDTAVFKNKEKTGQQPDYKGNALIDGKEYEIAYWIKESQNGEKFFSGKIKLKGTN